MIYKKIHQSRYQAELYTEEIEQILQDVSDKLGNDKQSISKEKLDLDLIGNLIFNNVQRVYDLNGILLNNKVIVVGWKWRAFKCNLNIFKLPSSPNLEYTLQYDKL